MNLGSQLGLTVTVVIDFVGSQFSYFFKTLIKFVDAVAHNWTHVPLSEKGEKTKTNHWLFDWSNWTRQIGRCPTRGMVLFSKILIAKGQKYKLAHNSP